MLKWTACFDSDITELNIFDRDDLDVSGPDKSTSLKGKEPSHSTRWIPTYTIKAAYNFDFHRIHEAVQQRAIFRRRHVECTVIDKPAASEAIRWQSIDIDLSSSPFHATFAFCIIVAAHGEARLSREGPAWFRVAVTVMNSMSHELFRRMKRAISRLRRGKIDRSEHQELMVSIATLLFTVPILEPPEASSDLWERKKKHLELVLCHHLRGFPLIPFKNRRHGLLPMWAYGFCGLTIGIFSGWGFYPPARDKD
jgi:hypothetical protein